MKLECTKQCLFEEQIRADERNKSLNELVESLEEIDNCEFAMYSLCLIKEKIEELKEKNNG